jgi:hypothetical protein
LSNTFSRRPLTSEFLRRLPKAVQRSLRIEHALIALLIAFAALQAYLIVGAKGS